MDSKDLGRFKAESSNDLVSLIKGWYLIGAQDMLAEVIDQAQAVDNEEEFKKKLNDWFMQLCRNRGHLLRELLRQDLG